MDIAKFFCILLTYILGFNLLLKAQQVYIPLDSCIKASKVIFEGEVISSTPFLDPDSNVHTSNIVKIYKTFKGNVQCGEVEIITDQSVDSGPYQIQILDGGFGLRKGECGIFICIPAWRPSLKAPKENPQPLQVYGAPGFVFYDIERGNTMRIINQDTSFPNTRMLYNYITGKTGRPYVACQVSEGPTYQRVVAIKPIDDSAAAANSRKTRLQIGHYLNVYPNPVVDYANLKVSDTGLVDLIIWDSSGKTVLQETNIDPVRLLNIDMRSLIPGTYEGSIYIQTTHYFFKFIKAGKGR